MKESEREIQGRKVRSHRAAREGWANSEEAQVSSKTSRFVEKRDFSLHAATTRRECERGKRKRKRRAEIRKGEVEHFALRPGAAHRGGELS